MTKKHQSGSVSYIFANYTTLTVKANSKMQTKRINIRQSNKRLFDHLILQSCQVYLYLHVCLCVKSRNGLFDSKHQSETPSLMRQLQPFFLQIDFFIKECDLLSF